MSINIRNIDERVYRQIKARAALEGRTVGDVLNCAMRSWLARPRATGQGSIEDLESLRFDSDDPGLSERIDEVVYDKPRK